MTTAQRPCQNHKVSFDKIENANPGFRVIAGPFNVESEFPKVAVLEKAACVRALRDQQRSDPRAKIVTVDRYAFVLRTIEGWRKERSKAGRGSRLN